MGWDDRLDNGFCGECTHETQLAFAGSETESGASLRKTFFLPRRLEGRENARAVRILLLRVARLLGLLTRAVHDFAALLAKNATAAALPGAAAMAAEFPRCARLTQGPKIGPHPQLWISADESLAADFQNTHRSCLILKKKGHRVSARDTF